MKPFAQKLGNRTQTRRNHFADLQPFDFADVFGENKYKLMNKLVLISFIVLTATVCHGQDRETRELPGFSRVSVGEGIELILREGNQEEAVVKTRDIDLGRVITEVKGSTLYIHLRKGIYRSVNVTVEVTYQDLLGLDVDSGARAKCESVIKGDEFAIDVNSAGKAVLELDVDALDVSVDSAGQLELSGRCNFHKLSVDSAGRLYAYDLKSKRVQGHVDSAGKAEVSVTDELRAHADSGGKLSYRGNPNKVIADSDSGGRVRKAY